MFLFPGAGFLSEIATLLRGFLYSMQLELPDSKGKAWDFFNHWLWCFYFLNVLSFLVIRKGNLVFNWKKNISPNYHLSMLSQPRSPLNFNSVHVM